MFLRTDLFLRNQRNQILKTGLLLKNQILKTEFFLRNQIFKNWVISKKSDSKNREIRFLKTVFFKKSKKSDSENLGCF